MDQQVRPIDAHAFAVHVALYMAQNAYLNDTALDVLKKVSRWLDEEPTLDYAPVRHGQWKYEEPVKDDGKKPFVCSACGLRHPRYGTVDKAYFSYCPWCGLPMDAEEGER